MNVQHTLIGISIFLCTATAAFAATANLSGSAWAENIGWITFNNTTIEDTHLSGSAYSDTSGWIDLNTVQVSLEEGDEPSTERKVIGSLPKEPPPLQSLVNSGTCPNTLTITQFMRKGDRNNHYSSYQKETITEVSLLQGHINRILASQYNQAAGPEDGIFGPLTKQGVQRLQTALNDTIKPTPPLIIDGIVGPFTTNAINHSCGV